ncbi:3-oxoadipate enol-lactonase 2 [Paramyrothecium foliicola]|nr:3-oxoadipate enol-lactonase 2 [Paramyrothecium foliicola]
MPFFSAPHNLEVFYSWTEVEGDNTLLCIHGLGSSSSFYSTIAPSLASDGLSCLAFDTPGSGLSNAEGVAPTVSSIAQVAIALLQSLGRKPEKTVVVGHSMGALIASEIALQIKALGVVLIGPVHPTPALGDIFTARINSVKQDGNLERLADAIPPAATGSAATSLHHAFIRALILSQTPQGYASLCKLIAEAVPPDYSSIRQPLLIIAGSDDKTSPLQGCQHILDSWGTEEPSKKLSILEGVGHWHCIENHAEVAKEIVTFFKSLLS